MERPPGSPAARAGIALRWLLGAAIALVLAHAGVRAAQIRIDYYDGYDYLRNARALAGDPLFEYQHLRPPFASIVQLPAMAIVRASPPAAPVRSIAPHATSAIVSALSAAAVGWLFSRSFGATLTLLGTLLFVTTRTFVHYAPFAMADLASAGWAAAATALYLRARERRSLPAFVVCGVALGAAVLTKYPLVVLGPAWAVAEGVLALAARRFDARAWLGLAIAGGVGAATLLGVEAILMRAVYGDDALAKLSTTLVELSTLAALGADPSERPSDYLAMSVAMLSLPTLLLAAGGVALCLRRRDARDAPQLASLLGLAGITVLAVRHTEARYLLPAVPFLLHFALRSLEAAHERLRARPERIGALGRGLAWLLAAAAVGIPIGAGIDQARLDADPALRSDTQRLAAEKLLAARRGEGRLLWLGGFHPLLTRAAGRVPHDEYFGVFHFAPFVAEYFVDQKLAGFAEPAPKSPPQLALWLRDGDAVLSASPELYDALHPPPHDLPPLEVLAARRLRFRALARGEFAHERDPAARLVLHTSPSGTRLTSNSLSGFWQVLLIGSAETSRWQAGSVALEPGRAVPISRSAPERVEAIELFQLERTPIP